MNITTREISEYMTCTNCGFEIHAHKIAIELINSGKPSPQSIYCPVCNVKYKLEYEELKSIDYVQNN